MKTFTLALLILFGQILNLIAQEKNNPLFQAEQISINLDDIIEALNVTGVQIFKFKTGEFNKKLEFTILLEEFLADTLKQKTILYTGTNWYITSDENGQPIDKFINTIRVISQKEDDKCKLNIDLVGFSLNRAIPVVKTYNRQFFKWRTYSDTQWTLNKKTPLMAYISSWQDKRGYIRFCGVPQLRDADEDTNQYFSRSPNYFIISYIANEINDKKSIPNTL